MVTRVDIGISAVSLRCPFRNSKSFFSSVLLPHWHSFSTVCSLYSEVRQILYHLSSPYSCLHAAVPFSSLYAVSIWEYSICILGFHEAYRACDLPSINVGIRRVVSHSLFKAQALTKELGMSYQTGTGKEIWPCPGACFLRSRRNLKLKRMLTATVEYFTRTVASSCTDMEKSMSGSLQAYNFDA